MMQLLWAFIAAGFVVGIESVYRGSGRSWWSLLPWVVLPILAAQFALYQMQQKSSDLMTATIFFSTFTAAIRIVVTLCVLREPVHMKTWVVTGLFCGVSLMKGVWK